jgi:transcriptional regulator with GAF, ATPase, and Fis domain
MSRDEHDDASTVSSAAPPRSPDGAVLSVLGGKGASVRLPGEEGRSIVVGKRGADLAIDHPSVSRRHLEVRRTREGLELTDLGSTNGTFIGGARVRSAIVEPGTVVRAGDVELLVAVELADVVIPPSEEERFGIVVGKSLPMRRIFGVLERVARTQASVLLMGETGTGKDALARSLHLRSKRESGPFEVVDCGAVAASLIESELFGHERGAFTGAVSSRAGAFERAAGGTLFLDEIGELALELQPKLLRVLEARELRRVGGNKVLTSDARIVAATTRDLRREVARGTFREDLYFRLAVVPVEVPPLRARLDDLAMLARKLLDSIAEPGELELSRESLAILRSYDWPGNVRELRNVLERAAHLSLGVGARSLVLTDVPPERARDVDELETRSFDPEATYRESRARFESAFERRYVRWLLERHGGNVSAAARSVKMDRNHLTDLARKHGLDPREKGGR